MKKSNKPNNCDSKLTYKKPPIMGGNAVAFYLAIVFFIGMFLYSYYYKKMNNKELVCTRDISFLVGDVNAPLKETVKMKFKKDVFSSGTIHKIYDLSTIDDSIFSEFAKTEMCGKISLPSASKREYTSSKCEKSINNKNIIIDIEYNINSDKEIKLDQEQKSFEKSNYMCEVK